jgi:hypothetical protein
MRRRHQTRQAALGVRTRSSRLTAAENSGSTLKLLLFHGMRQALKEQDDHAVGTGMDASQCFGPCGSATTTSYSRTMAWEWHTMSAKHCYVWMVNLNPLCSHCILFQNWWQEWVTRSHHRVIKHQCGIIPCFEFMHGRQFLSHPRSNISSTDKAVCTATFDNVPFLAFCRSKSTRSRWHSRTRTGRHWSVQCSWPRKCQI